MPKRGGAKTTRVCWNCGESFMAYLIELHRREVKFCSAKCYNDYRKQNKLTVLELNERQVERNHKIKKEVLSHYSGGYPQCAHCNIDDIAVLCLDHIDGGGTKDRLDTRHWGAKLYYYLRKNNYPIGYQVLCANCNLKKFVVEGI